MALGFCEVLEGFWKGILNPCRIWSYKNFNVSRFVVRRLLLLWHVGRMVRTTKE
jgi:hypothetical protein